MARTQAVLPGGARLSDYLSVGVIAQVYPLAQVKAALEESGRRSKRQRSLPAEVMVYYVIALGLFRSVSAREVLRCLVDGLRWMASGVPVRVSGKSSISRARTRLGAEPFEALCRTQVGLVAERQTRGAWYRGLRLVAFDGSTLDVPDEAENREAFGVGRPVLLRIPVVATGDADRRTFAVAGKGERTLAGPGASWRRVVSQHRTRQWPRPPTQHGRVLDPGRGVPHRRSRTRGVSACDHAA